MENIVILTVLITYVTMCVITIILSQIDDDYALYWAAGIPYILISILVRLCKVFRKATQKKKERK